MDSYQIQKMGRGLRRDWPKSKALILDFASSTNREVDDMKECQLCLGRFTMSDVNGEWIDQIFTFPCPKCGGILGTQTTWFEVSSLEVMKRRLKPNKPR